MAVTFWSTLENFRAYGSNKLCGKIVDPHFPGCRIAWVGEVVALAFVAVSIFAAVERIIR